MSFLKFEDFLLFESRNGKLVCFMPGRFQPTHLGHIAAFERTSKKIGCTVIPIQIISKTNKSPFPVSLLTKIAKEIKKEFSFIEDFLILPSNIKPFVPDIITFLQSKGYSPVGMGCGIDRIKDYERQADYVRTGKYDVKIEDFEVAMVDERGSDGYSGTAVRNALKNDVYDEFVKMTPKCMHKFYEDLKSNI